MIKAQPYNMCSSDKKLILPPGGKHELFGFFELVFLYKIIEY